MSGNGYLVKPHSYWLVNDFLYREILKYDKILGLYILPMRINNLLRIVSFLTCGLYFHVFFQVSKLI